APTRGVAGELGLRRGGPHLKGPACKERSYTLHDIQRYAFGSCDDRRSEPRRRSRRRQPLDQRRDVALGESVEVEPREHTATHQLGDRLEKTVAGSKPAIAQGSHEEYPGVSEP